MIIFTLITITCWNNAGLACVLIIGVSKESRYEKHIIG